MANPIMLLSETDRRFARRRLLGIAIVIMGIAAILQIARYSWLKPAVATGEDVFMPADTVSPLGQQVRDAVGFDSDILLDPRFAVTSNRPPPWIRMPIPGMSEAKRLEYEIRWKFRKATPESHSISPSSTKLASIHGILSQLTEITGIRFLIAKGVANGAVEFEHTNTLNGSEFAKAFTDALRTRRPGWLEVGQRETRRENLALLTRDGKNVLVVPNDMTSEFREKDFKDFEWGLQ